MDFKLSLPFAEDLTNEAGWLHPDRYLYFTPRFHLHIEQSQTNEFTFGEILRTFHTTPHSETEVTKTFEEEVTVADTRETTRSITLANDLSQKVAATIAGAAKTPFYEVSANIGASLEQTIRSSLTQSLRSSETVSQRVKKIFTVSQKVTAGAQERQVAVAGFRRYHQDVFLHYMDYLFVEYRSTTFGLRRKKRNLPHTLGELHINRIQINMPLFRLMYWNVEPESSLLYAETEYRNLTRVAHLDRVTLEELHKEISLPLPSRPTRPTLYTLSNFAFPLHWVDRKGPWTREELEQSELTEAEGSAWWYQHGPGRKQK